MKTLISAFLLFWLVLLMLFLALSIRIAWLGTQYPWLNFFIGGGIGIMANFFYAPIYRWVEKEYDGEE
jgi:hypothetical protein